MGGRISLDGRRQAAEDEVRARVGLGLDEAIAVGVLFYDEHHALVARRVVAYWAQAVLDVLGEREAARATAHILPEARQRLGQVAHIGVVGGREEIGEAHRLALAYAGKSFE